MLFYRFSTLMIQWLSFHFRNHWKSKRSGFNPEEFYRHKRAWYSPNESRVHDTMCAVLPLHHVFGSAACIAAALTSGLIGNCAVYKGPLILEALREKEVTILPVVPR